MRSEVRLDSAVFQLTPTRTRCDLVVIANGKTEKIASGLLNPFLAHLKAAQDQIAKGGYSITLEPGPNKDAEWFTKGTVERFVRFVSTPEVLERVNTIESEILQIEEAIAIQGNDTLGLSTVEDNQTKPAESIEGSRSNYVVDMEKAIVLYKPGSHAPEANGSTVQENSKAHLLRVLETRKIVLQKEQGMAFARAVAAGFDLDHMSQLISFAECFGALRLLEACFHFMDLWKTKHESGQWLEIEAAEAMSRSEFSPLNSSGIILSGDFGKQTEYRELWPEPNGDLGMESNGKGGANAGQNRDRRSSSDPQASLGPNEYYQGQFQHPMFSQWPIHSAPGAPVFQPYPVQGMPYYQNYPSGAPFFQPPYPPMEDPRFTSSHNKLGRKRHSMDSKDSNTELESLEMGASGARSKDAAEELTESEDEKKTHKHRESHKRDGRSGKEKGSGKAYSRKSKRHDTSESESDSGSDSQTEENSVHEQHEDPGRKHKHSSRSSKKKSGQTNSVDISYDKDDVTHGQEADSGNWQVFQSFLMRDEEGNTNRIDRGMFSGEKEPVLKRKERKESNFGGDPLVPPERDTSDVKDLRVVEFDSVSGKLTRVKQVSLNEELLFSMDKRNLEDGHLESRYQEIEGANGIRRTTANDEFMVYRQQRTMSNKSFSDPLAENNEFQQTINVEKSSSHQATDESFIVPHRSDTHEELFADSRTALDMDSELPSALQGGEGSSVKFTNQFNYEPHDLSLIPEREGERESVGYDPAVDYDMEIHVEDVKLKTLKLEDDPSSNKEDLKKLSKEKMPKVGQNTADRRRMDLMRKGRSSKSNPLAEAQARAEKLRAYKVDLQKIKKEKEEEAIKRLEALKMERQKRIAAKSGTGATQPAPTQQTRARLPAKVSPNSYKGSKFSDSEPGSSPLQKLAGRTNSLGTNGSVRATQPRSSNPGINFSGSGLSRSVSSLPELKNENNSLTPEEKAASLRSKRLSDPKTNNSTHTSQKSVINDTIFKKTTSSEPQKKKISAIVHLDKMKTAVLPELKIGAARCSSDATQDQSAIRGARQKVTGSKSSQTSQNNQTKKTNEKTSRLSNSDESPIIDKTIVMLENDTNSAPSITTSEGMGCIKDGPTKYSGSENVEVVSEYAAICAPPSPVLVGEMENTIKHKVVINCPADESQELSNSSVSGKIYQAPYARVTSLEDPATSNSEYTEAPSLESHQTISTGPESIEPLVTNFPNSRSTEQIHDAVEKPRNKEMSKGLRRLFKFGKKNHNSSSGDHNLESDCSSIDDSTSIVSTDVAMLKNLISQDDTHIGSTHKVSCHFSILSPFRTKSNEKKLAA